MKASIDRDGCISCGLCVDTCPKVFKMAADDVAEVYVDVVPAEEEGAVTEAAEGCPVGVITVE